MESDTSGIPKSSGTQKKALPESTPKLSMEGMRKHKEPAKRAAMEYFRDIV